MYACMHGMGQRNTRKHEIGWRRSKTAERKRKTNYTRGYYTITERRVYMTITACTRQFLPRPSFFFFKKNKRLCLCVLPPTCYNKTTEETIKIKLVCIQTRTDRLAARWTVDTTRLEAANTKNSSRAHHIITSTSRHTYFQWTKKELALLN